jgi:hypothetical protein
MEFMEGTTSVATLIGLPDSYQIGTVPLIARGLALAVIAAHQLTPEKSNRLHRGLV